MAKKNKSMLGALMIVGKDNKGQKVILPNSDKLIRKEIRKKTSIIKRFLNAFRERNERYKLVKIDSAWSRRICADYMDKVSDKVSTAQETWKKNKRELVGLKY